MVELELLERRERPVALLDEQQPPLLRVGRSIQAVVGRDRLAQERQGDEHDRTDRQGQPQDDPRHAPPRSGARNAGTCAPVAGSVKPTP
ncbi:MAG TPA: hypothetical protein VMH47_01585 [Gaiellaceae bacterium]|nr:hypothetical protein [Gaiellaceae bacterium]